MTSQSGGVSFTQMTVNVPAHIPQTLRSEHNLTKRETQEAIDAWLATASPDSIAQVWRDMQGKPKK